MFHFPLKVHRKYTGADFDEDLRTVLRRSGCRNEKIAFILDEGNLLESSFLERMNTLLANGEVPGLFEGDEFTTLMTQCKEGSQKEGLMLDSGEELYKWFTNQVIKNLHVVFTMNPSSEGLKSRAATSPALFNRCVLNWFGDWSTGALYQVGSEFTSKLDLEKSTVSVWAFRGCIYLLRGRKVKENSYPQQIKCKLIHRKDMAISKRLVRIFGPKCRWIAYR